MTMRTFVLFFALVFLVSSSLQAGVVPGRWEKVDSQASTTALVVMLKSGEWINCFLKQSDPESLTVVDPVNGERRIAKQDVDRVQTSQQVSDPVWDGILIGMLVGVVPGLLNQGEVKAGGGSRGAYWAYGLLLGGAVGYLVDKTREGPEVLYVAK